MGIEPTTSGTTIQCSNQLSYTHHRRGLLIAAFPSLARFVLIALIASACIGRRAPILSLAEQERARHDIESFSAFALQPATLAPPSIAFEELTAQAGSVVVRARPLLPEEQHWNRWSDGSARLFNNRMAHLYSVEVEGPGPLLWDPDATTLELNDGSRVLVASPTADPVIGDLLYRALQQEKWALDGDLTERTRGAGPFRSAYLPRSGRERIAGVVAFPVAAESMEELAELSTLHVVAVRLTVSVADQTGLQRAVMVFQ
jgi:hypothetical protein